MNLCILENDFIDPCVAHTYISYANMVNRLLQSAGANWNIAVFRTYEGVFPDSYSAFDVVLLTGSRADAFSNDPWVVQLRSHVNHLLQIKKKLLGICFGHQLIAFCLGSKVGRAPQGWGMGRMTYQWTKPFSIKSISIEKSTSSEVSLLASHQDQVFDLPKGATLLASSTFCPIAAFSYENHVFCVQAHPEFVPEYSTYLIEKRRSSLAEEHYSSSISSLGFSHDGINIARMMVSFVEDGVI